MLSDSPRKNTIWNHFARDAAELSAKSAAMLAISRLNSLRDIGSIFKAEEMFRTTCHPNGFQKVTLVSRPDCSIRLHLWESDALFQEKQKIHGHAWSMYSLILFGGVENLLFHEEKRSGSPYYRYLYEAGSSGGRHQLTFDRQVLLEKGRLSVHLEGDLYFLDRKAIHASRPTSEGTVTLVFTEKDTSHLANQVPVYSDIFQGERIDF